MENYVIKVYLYIKFKVRNSLLFTKSQMYEIKSYLKWLNYDNAKHFEFKNKFLRDVYFLFLTIVMNCKTK